MGARDYLRILQKRWKIVVPVSVLVVLLAALATFATTPVYQAKSQLFVSVGSSQSDASTLAQSSNFSQARVKSYAAIVDSPAVLNPVITQLRLDTDAVELSLRVNATVPLDTVLINVTADDTNAEQSAAIANAVSAQFAKYVDLIEAPDTNGKTSVKVTPVRVATPPTIPISPRTKLNLALGLLLGLALGIGLALLRDSLDTRIKTEDDLDYLERDEQRHVPVIGTIAKDQDAERAPLIAQAMPQSLRSEAFRRLRTNLQFIDVDNPPRSIVVTSSLSGEGKTTTTTNLAISLAQAGLTVALIDADLRQPRMASYMGIEGAVGLTDVLIGRAKVEDILQAWGQTNLKVLPSGNIPPNPSELLGSMAMRDLLSQLAASFDIVLIDTPPLLPVTDAAVISAIVDGTVLIVRANTATRDQVEESIDTLRAVDANLLGIVLTMTKQRTDSAGYGYGYGVADNKSR